MSAPDVGEWPPVEAATAERFRDRVETTVLTGAAVTVPLAPNPFMGRHLLTLPADRVADVEMSVEEGVQAVVTSGVAIDERTVEGT